TACTHTLTNVLFIGNRATEEGGPVLNAGCHVPFTNGTFNGNRAASGRSLWNQSSTIIIQNTLMWGNSPENIFNHQDNQIPIPPPILTYRHNLIQGMNAPGVGNLNGTTLANNPLFVLPVECGGDGCTDDPETPGVDESANDNYGDMRLQPNSPAVD